MLKFFLLLLLSPTSKAQVTCIAVGEKVQYQNYHGLSKEEKRRLQTEYFIGNPYEFYKRNIMLRFLNSKNSPPVNCSHIKIESLEAHASEVFFSMAGKDRYFPWESALVSTRKTREFSYLKYFNDYRASWSHQKSSESDSKRAIPADYERYKKMIFAKDHQDLREYFSVKESTLGLRPNFNYLEEGSVNRVAKEIKDKVLSRGLCYRDSTFNLASCIKGTDAIAKYFSLSISPAGDILNIPLWKKVYSSEYYAEGLRLAALIMMDRVIGDLKPNANLYEDLMEGFSRIGLDAILSVNAVWDIIGLISNSGPNMANRLANVEGHSQRSNALTYIAMVGPYLDMKKAGLGYPLYTFPPHIKISADVSKSYYFWMASYLSRNLVLEQGLPPQDAVRTTFLALKAYQIRRRELRNTPSSLQKNAIFTRNAFDPASQIVRLDIAQAAAGAYYGVKTLRANSTTEIDIDSIMLSLIRASPVLDPLSKNAANELTLLDAYNTFLRVFVPDVALSELPLSQL